MRDPEDDPRIDAAEYERDRMPYDYEIQAAEKAYERHMGVEW